MLGDNKRNKLTIFKDIYYVKSKSPNDMPVLHVGAGCGGTEQSHIRYGRGSDGTCNVCQRHRA